MPLSKQKKLFVSETLFRFCAINLQISFLALAIASKKMSKTVSEIHAKWLQFGTVSETRDYIHLYPKASWSRGYTTAPIMG